MTTFDYLLARPSVASRSPRFGMESGPMGWYRTATLRCPICLRFSPRARCMMQITEGGGEDDIVMSSECDAVGEALADMLGLVDADFKPSPDAEPVHVTVVPSRVAPKPTLSQLAQQSRLRRSSSTDKGGRP